MFYLIVNKTLHHCHPRLARQYITIFINLVRKQWPYDSILLDFLAAITARVFSDL